MEKKKTGRPKKIFNEEILTSSEILFNRMLYSLKFPKLERKNLIKVWEEEGFEPSKEDLTFTDDDEIIIYTPETTEYNDDGKCIMNCCGCNKYMYAKNFKYNMKCSSCYRRERRLLL